MKDERHPEFIEPLDREAPPPAEWLRLAKYLLGELDDEGCAEVERWVADGPVRAPVVALLRDVWQTPALQEQRGDSAAALARVMEQIGVAQETVPVELHSQNGVTRQVFSKNPWRTSHRKVWPLLAGVAAGAAMILTVWGGTAGLSRTRGSSMAPTVYATHNGQRADITLADGSTVTLGVASRLEVPADFARGNRTVRLDDGEALFTVAHTKGVPFTVMAGAATTRVLGTTFLVRHYAADTTALVAVRDGKVAVQSTVLTAQQQVLLDRHGVLRIGKTEAIQFAFTTGVLMLDRMTFQDAIPQLDRWYDVDIRVNDPVLAGRQLHGSFAAGSMSDLMELLELVVDSRVVRHGRVLTLYPK
jgi:ferric-dicitrate binding protein FerR (iron transport regulator)